MSNKHRSYFNVLSALVALSGSSAFAQPVKPSVPALAPGRSSMPSAPTAPVAAAPAAPMAPTAPIGSSSGSNALAPPPSLFGDGGMDITKLRDPFKQPELKMSKTEPKSDLENYKVDDFKMVAVVTGPYRVRAMVQSPDGKSHLVAQNSKIGQRGGKVLKVTADEVVVREKIVNVFGQEEDLDTEIKLQPEVNR